ncbi:MAG: CoA ester lyase [Acidimicrobiia bacterium]|nr:CoA ester lyase [Acidimicrobiia bacterium]
MTEPARLSLRSVLFVPGGRADMIAKTPRSAPDAVIVDLEDAVAAADKAEARATAVAAVDALDVVAPTIVLLRVNPAGTRWFADDVAAAAGSAAAGVVLPKLERVGQLEDLRSRLTAAGRPDAVVAAGLESALGVADGRELLAAGADAGLAAVYFGAEDYIADVGGRRSVSGTEVLYARSHVCLAASLAGVTALDQVVVDVAADEHFLADARAAADLGYGGKCCIHPRQVALAHSVFTPSDEDVAHALAVLDAGDAGVALVDGQMIDEVHLKMARAVLRRAGREA